MLRESVSPDNGRPLPRVQPIGIKSIETLIGGVYRDYFNKPSRSESFWLPYVLAGYGGQPRGQPRRESCRSGGPDEILDVRDFQESGRGCLHRGRYLAADVGLFDRHHGRALPDLLPGQEAVARVRAARRPGSE